MAAVTIKTEPPEYVAQDEEPSCHPVSVKSGLGGAAAKESQPDAVPVHPTGPHPVLARPPQGVVPPVSDRAQPRVKVVYFRKVERGIATLPVVTTLPVAALQSLLAAESPQPGVVPVWLPGSGESLGSLGGNVFVAFPLVCRYIYDDRRHVCPQEVAGPQNGKSELDQFGKLFTGGLDCSTTDSKAALSSHEVSLCSYELDVDAPKESRARWSGLHQGFRGRSARRDVSLHVCVLG
ncbi:hypothetical protein IscW_ISCW004163 [Ixodes scapularis]|uniref:Uncharacterized protein n=1 Tax=Ixodes scapularis TaxID=6945 RepID=B7PFC1_IXOSC|nr:hypothetical protein IscW_ISCW004163 [Ixodes scapularis]|eukprot:XP_002433893.1 hypothetical protein IscW_ISCW004163 [Ixodes scapularis]